MNVKATAINLFANRIIGGREFGAAKDIVATLEDMSIPGEEKRRLAVARLEQIGYSLAGFMLNLAVELAVAWLNFQLGKK